MSAIFFILIAYVVVYILSSIVIIQPNKVSIVERLGKFHRIIGTGLQFVFNPIEKIRHLVVQDKTRMLNGEYRIVQTFTKQIDLSETVYEYTINDVITKNNSKIDMKILVHFQIVNVLKAVYSSTNFAETIMNVMTKNIKILMQSHTQDEIFYADLLSDFTLKDNIFKDTEELGIEIKCIEAQDIIKKD